MLFTVSAGMYNNYSLNLMHNRFQPKITETKITLNLTDILTHINTLPIFGYFRFHSVKYARIGFFRLNSAGFDRNWLYSARNGSALHLMNNYCVKT